MYRVAKSLERPVELDRRSRPTPPPMPLLEYICMKSILIVLESYMFSTCSHNLRKVLEIELLHPEILQHLMLEFLEDIGKVFETTVYFFKVLKIDKKVIKIILRIFLINFQGVGKMSC